MQNGRGNPQTNQSPAPSNSSRKGSQSDCSQLDVIPAPLADNWGDLVAEFQDTFQDFREAVVTGGCDEVESATAFTNLQKALKDVGGKVLQSSRSDKTEGQVQKAKCQQFLQYVSNFSQHHQKLDMHAFFADLLKQSLEGNILSNFVYIRLTNRSQRRRQREDGGRRCDEEGEGEGEGRMF